MYEELLEHINKDIDQGGFANSCGEWFPARSLLALRAVVELHKPLKVNDITLCDNEPLIYPCPTIQAIEKELA